MKSVYVNISRTQFLVILILILLLPVSKKYRLLLFGKKTYGVVVDHGIEFSKSRYSSTYQYAIIRFEVNGIQYRTEGPQDVNYNIGEKVTILYNPKDPDKCLLFSIFYFYSMPNVLLPCIVFFVWIAFYSSFKPPKNSVAQDTFEG